MLTLSQSLIQDVLFITGFVYPLFEQIQVGTQHFSTYTIFEYQLFSLKNNKNRGVT